MLQSNTVAARSDLTFLCTEASVLTHGGKNVGYSSDKTLEDSRINLLSAKINCIKKIPPFILCIPFALDLIS